MGDRFQDAQWMPANEPYMYYVYGPLKDFWGKAFICKMA